MTTDAEAAPWYEALRPALFSELPLAARRHAIDRGTSGALGLVIEVPVDGGWDTVGAYADGAFRYYNAVRGAELVEPDALPTINDAASDLVLLANGLTGSTVADGGLKMTVLTPSGRRVCDDSSRVGQLISAKAMNAVMECGRLRERDASPAPDPKGANEPKPVMYLHRIVAVATERNQRCVLGERHRIFCWSTTSDAPIGAFFAGFLADEGWGNIELENVTGFRATPTWAEPRDAALIESYERAARVGWSVLVFGEKV